MVINDMEVEKLWREDGINQMGLDNDPYEITKPENLLNYIDDTSTNIEESSIPKMTNDEPSDTPKNVTGADSMAGPY